LSKQEKQNRCRQCAEAGRICLVSK